MFRALAVLILSLVTNSAFGQAAQAQRIPRMPDGKPNFTGLWQSMTTANWDIQNWWKLDPEVKCYMPGVPRATYMPYPIQIVQGTSNIAIAYEYATSNRVVNMGKPTEAPTDTWMGWSNGHWEGDTLVVDVTGMNDQTWFDRAGNFHSEALHVVERYSFRNPDVINYEATIEDPMVFTRQWKISLPLYRRLDKNAQLTEFKCVEFAEELLYGDLRRQPKK